MPRLLKRPSENSTHGWTLGFGHNWPLATVLSGLTLLTLAAGCQQSKTPPPAAGKATDQKSTAASATKPTDNAVPTPSATDVLKYMVRSYRKASSYSDNGVAHMSAEADGQKILDTTAKFSVAYMAPNKVRVQAYGAEMVCDGRKMYAYVQDVPGQVMVRNAPERLSVATVPPDLVVFATMTQDFAGGLPQIGLLFDNHATDSELLDAAGKPEMLEPGEFNGHNCYRIKIPKKQGDATYWIDCKDYTLRRIVVPTDALRKKLSAELQKPISNISVTADFVGARLGGDVDPKAFQFELPADAKEVPFINPPQIRQLLAQKTPAFEFVDFSGHPVTQQSTAGKTVVLMFWATQAEECKDGLGDFEQLYQKYKDNPKFAFYAVSIDPEKYPTDELKKDVAKLNLHAPALRDSKHSAAAFNLQTCVPPCTFVIDAKGTVQYCESGRNPKYVATMQPLLDKVAAGGNVYQEPLKQYEAQVDEYRKYAAEPVIPAAPKETPVGGKSVLLPETQTAPATKPAVLKLSPLWQSSELKSPGNIIVAADKGKPPRLWIIENSNSVAEVGLDGKVLGIHPFELDKSEVVCNLRTGVGADGRRYIAAFWPAYKRVHVMDDQGKVVLHYPQNSSQAVYGGISDVQLGDLDGDGKLKLYIGHWAIAGAHAVSLDGHRLWVNRSDMSGCSSLAVTGPDAKGQRDLLCDTERGSVVSLSPHGKLISEFSLRNRILQRIVGADLLHDGPMLWCGSSSVGPNDNTIVGFSLTSDLLWTYSPPPGIPPRPIEPIIPGRVLLGSAGQWLLPGPDGSIHILAANGKLIDKFNYGATLQGLASVEIDGRPAIVVASARKLEAFRIEQ